MIDEFSWRKRVVEGVVRNNSVVSGDDISAIRIWIHSSIQFFKLDWFEQCQQLETAVFENGSRLTRIEADTFGGSGLRDIISPLSVEILCPSSFYICRSLVSVTFESGSRLMRTEAETFRGSGLCGLFFSNHQLKFLEVPLSMNADCLNQLYLNHGRDWFELKNGHSLKRDCMTLLFQRQLNFLVRSRFISANHLKQFDLNQHRNS
jgi:hypothetical protein